MPNSASWFFSEHIQKNEDLKFIIERCVNRLLFICLYTIDPDILISGLCQKLRENIKPEDLPFDPDILEDKVGEVVHLIMKDEFATKNEIQNFLVLLGSRMLELIAPNKAQKEFEEKKVW